MQSEPDRQVSGTLTLSHPAKPGKNEFVFRCLLPEGHKRFLESLRLGSELEVTGVVQLHYAPNISPRLKFTHHPADLELILHGPEGVRVLQHPSWWTVQHLSAVLAAVLCPATIKNSVGDN